MRWAGQRPISTPPLSLFEGRDGVGWAHSPALCLLQEKNARLLGAAQQLFGHCQAQKEEIKKLFQQKLDEVELPEARMTQVQN